MVGAGPTGVEFCGELLDFLESEALAFYPKLVGEASVTGTQLAQFGAEDGAFLCGNQIFNPTSM